MNLKVYGKKNDFSNKKIEMSTHLKCVIVGCDETFTSRAKLKDHLIYFHNQYEATFM